MSEPVGGDAVQAGVWLLILACVPSERVLAAPPPEPIDYDQAVASLEADRQALRGDVPAARARLQQALREEIWPAWYGTEWEFYGTTQTPGEGTIACGYFVSTTLEHAGFQVERVKLAQQASSVIVDTFGPATWTWGESPKQVVERLPPGIHLVGLDYHVAFLDRRPDGDWLCHSSVLEPGSVVCEVAQDAEALQSNVHVTGPLLSDAVVQAWLDGRAFPTGG